MTEETLSKKQKIINIVIAAIILIPIALMTISIIQSKNLIIKDLAELDRQREIAFTEISPILIRYKDDHDVFPDVLNKLVPEYTDSIPRVLQITDESNEEYDRNDMSMEYVSDGVSASFHYRRGYSHTPVIIYNVLTSSYSDKQDIIEAEK